MPENKLYLVEWLEGYSNAKPQIVELDLIKSGSEWDMDAEFIDALSSLGYDQTINYYEPCSEIRFRRISR